VVVRTCLPTHDPSVGVDNKVGTVYIGDMDDNRTGRAPIDETVIITGGTSGIGRATAVALAESGARVILAVRNEEKGRAVASDLPGTRGTHRVRHLDLARLETVEAFASGVDEPVAILVNNAGVESKDLQRTADGHELQFGTNHLGHFLLTTLLLPRITDRVVTVASQAERMARLDLTDLDWYRRTYNAGRAYADSKLANLLFTSELDRRLLTSGSHVRAFAAHPGLVKTAIYQRPAGQRPNLWDRLVPILGQEPEDGALPSLLAATADLPGGTFVGPQRMMHMRGGAEVIGRSKQAQDPETAARLWSISEQMTAVDARP
jgi:NAD(P)-dependent dehydrogenase (short-subunit alcohol dehydrogenase family)